MRSLLKSIKFFQTINLFYNLSNDKLFIVFILTECKKIKQTQMKSKPHYIKRYNQLKFYTYSLK